MSGAAGGNAPAPFARDAVARLSAALGGGPVARLAASALVEADALGQPRFGISMLDEWTPGALPPPRDADPRAIGWRDCASGFAPLAVAAATLDLGKAARHFGIAAVFLRGVRGFGRLAPFVRELADGGLVGLMGAEGPPIVAAHGGKSPVIGTNPIALAMGQGAARVVIDIATGSATMADIARARADGTPLARGVALDGAGRPTRIASQVAALLPRGGQVGALLGLMVELLAGIAGGGRGDANGRGVFILAFDPAAAGQGDGIATRLAQLRAEWTAGGGHWPRGGGLPPDTVLGPDFARRLDAQIDRIRAG